MNRSLILGYGITGKSFENYLLHLGEKFDIYDKRSISKTSKSLKNKINFNQYNAIYISPGINFKKEFSEISTKNLNFVTDLDIFFKENKSFKIGITGTNGKSTLAYYLEQLLNEVSSAVALGNYGEPLLNNLSHKKKYSIIEVSSFQLEKMQNNFFDLSVITNIKRDHIDFHGSFKSYKDSKFKILREGIRNIVWNDENDLNYLAFKILDYLKPNHNLKNFKLDNLPHRLETFKEGFINDSKSTNLSSLDFALDKLCFSGILVLCGDPKKENYMRHRICGPKKILIFGNHASELNKLIEHEEKIIFKDLDSLLKYILQIKKRGLEVLFSPGHPSGDDFKNFHERGNYFKKKVNEYFS